MSIIEHAGYYDNAIYNVSHVHTSCEIMHIVNGRTELTTEGESITLTNGDSVLIKSRQHHSVTVNKDIEYKRFITVINPWELRRQLVRPDLFSMLTDLSRGGIILMKNKPELRPCFEKMTDIFSHGGNIYSELSAALDIISQFYDVVGPTEKGPTKRSGKILSEKVRAYIENNYADGITIADVAEKCYISVGYLAHAFKAEIGMSPREYLTHIRCTRAYELIRHTTMKFSDIAVNTGFCSQSDMSRKIREYYGITPTEIRFE